MGGDGRGEVPGRPAKGGWLRSWGGSPRLDNDAEPREAERGLLLSYSGTRPQYSPPARSYPQGFGQAAAPPTPTTVDSKTHNAL